MHECDNTVECAACNAFAFFAFSFVAVHPGQAQKFAALTMPAQKIFVTCECERAAANYLGMYHLPKDTGPISYAVWYRSVDLYHLPGPF